MTNNIPVVIYNPDVILPDETSPIIRIIQNGWTAQLANVERTNSDGSIDIVQKVIDWTGGYGSKPRIDLFISEEGYVENINLATALLVGKTTSKLSTISELRAYIGGIPALQFYTTDKGQEGNWYYDSTDTTSLDNTGTIIVSADGKRFKRVIYDSIDVRWFGAKADGVTDDGPAVQKAVTYTALAGGGQIIFPARATYKIATKVIVPSNITIDISGSRLIGSGSTIGIMFETGSIVSGDIVTNWGTAEGSNLVINTRIFNGRIENVAIAFNLYNFIWGSSIDSITFKNCRQAWVAKACYYMQASNTKADGSGDINYPCYSFTEQNNLISLRNVKAVMPFGFHFAGGSTSITMDTCSFEGGSIGVKVSDDCIGLAIVGMYAEAVPGRLFDFRDANDLRFDISAGYYNYIDIVLDDGGATGASIIGDWHSSNAIVNVNQTVGGNLYRGRMQIESPGNLANYELAQNSDGLSAIPSNWITSKASNVFSIVNIKGATASDIRAKHIVRGNSIIPINRSGDVGAPGNQTIPFSSWSVTTTSVTINTKIVYQPNSLFARFLFTILTNSTPTLVCGDIYGTFVKRQDGNGGTLSMVDNAGFVTLTVTGLSIPPVALVGSVQILS